jgi:carboxyl-terminal processing protease
MLISILLSACSGLIPLDNGPVTGDFGLNYSLQEHQTRTFEALWKNIQDAYIYYDTANVDWNALHDKYINKIKAGLTADEFDSLLKGLERDLPEGSVVYQSRPERIQLDMTDASTYDGIGAFVGFQEQGVPHIVILSVIQGSPAEAAGLRAHDSIFGIDGSPIVLQEGLGAVDRIRGPAGTSVKLDIQSPGEPKRTVNVKRASLNSTGKLEASMISGTDYGYLLFPPIGYQGLDQDVFDSLKTLATNRELKGLILDLRIANSSQNWPLEALATMFSNGPLGELYNRSQKQTVEVTEQDVVGSQTVPLVILVGKNTNGFSEIFAASLQLAKRAVIVGEQTPGKVETQSSFYLPDGSRIFVESTSFRLSNGAEIGNTGVTPDIRVDASWDQIQPDNDPVVDQAVKVLGSAK